ncbi:hypothetical protein EBT31_03770 [bacterium]|nr:hypothetical protein [bacterium]
MPNSKISALTSATTPLTGSEVLPIVQSGATVKVPNNDLRPKQIQSNATSGVLQVAGPTAGTTRVMTTPDANFTAARTDAAQTFTGAQTFSNDIYVAGASGTTGNGNLSNGGQLAVLASNASARSFSSIYKYSASNNATVDAWYGRDASGSVFGNGFLIGHFYVYVTGASGANAFSGVYSIVTTGNSTSQATLGTVSTVTRGTSPVTSIQIANDGVNGAIKLTITYINNSGVVTGGNSTVTFVGQIA